jgi:hypothetical protein
MYFESPILHQLDMKYSFKDVAIAALAVLFLVFLIDSCDRYILNRTTDTDTVVVERKIILPPDTVFVDKIQAKTVWRKWVVYDTLTQTYYETDTVFQTKPFTSIMDTTIGCNSYKLEFRYPENTFNNLNFVSCPDTIVVQDTQIVSTPSLPYLEAVKYTTYGAIGGFVIGLLIK